jgi:hypothetical protein
MEHRRVLIEHRLDVDEFQRPASLSQDPLADHESLGTQSRGPMSILQVRGTGGAKQSGLARVRALSRGAISFIFRDIGAGARGSNRDAETDQDLSHLLAPMGVNHDRLTALKREVRCRVERKPSHVAHQSVANQVSRLLFHYRLCRPDRAGSQAAVPAPSTGSDKLRSSSEPKLPGQTRQSLDPGDSGQVDPHGTQDRTHAFILAKRDRIVFNQLPFALIIPNTERATPIGTQPRGTAHRTRFPPGGKLVHQSRSRQGRDNEPISLHAERAWTRLPQ